MKKTKHQINGISNISRFLRIINEAKQKLNLNLKDFIIITEAASGNYICTPIIAALSGAKKVYAFAKDSKYGLSEKIFDNTESLAEIVGIKNKIKYITQFKPEIINEADIITNLGFIRPLKKDFIRKMKPTAVIPLMRETWEFREDEIDLKACRENGIVVFGTNENYPNLRIFDYLGHLCAKKLFESNIEIFSSKIIVIGGKNFGINIMKYLAKMGANVKTICNEEIDIVEKLGVEKIGSLSSQNIEIEKIRNVDAIIIATYPLNVEIIGDNGLLKIKELKSTCPGICIVQLKGNIDRTSIKNKGLFLLPPKRPKKGHMSWTLNELGPKPVIYLHTGGLKVGEILAKLRKRGYSYEETVRMALNYDIVQDFSNKQKTKYQV